MQLIVQPMMEEPSDVPDGWGCWDDEIFDRTVKHMCGRITVGDKFGKFVWRGGDGKEDLLDHEGAKAAKKRKREAAKPDPARGPALKQRRVSGYFRKPVLVDEEVVGKLVKRVEVLEKTVAWLKLKLCRRRRVGLTPSKELLRSVKLVKRKKRETPVVSEDCEEFEEGEEEEGKGLFIESDDRDEDVKDVDGGSDGDGSNKEDGDGSNREDVVQGAVANVMEVGDGLNKEDVEEDVVVECMEVDGKKCVVGASEFCVGLESESVEKSLTDDGDDIPENKGDEGVGMTLGGDVLPSDVSKEVLESVVGGMYGDDEGGKVGEEDGADSSVEVNPDGHDRVAAFGDVPDGGLEETKMGDLGGACSEEVRKQTIV